MSDQRCGGTVAYTQCIHCVARKQYLMNILQLLHNQRSNVLIVQWLRKSKMLEGFLPEGTALRNNETHTYFPVNMCSSHSNIYIEYRWTFLYSSPLGDTLTSFLHFHHHSYAAPPFYLKLFTSMCYVLFQIPFWSGEIRDYFFWTLQVDLFYFSHLHWNLSTWQQQSPGEVFMLGTVDRSLTLTQPFI